MATVNRLSAILVLCLSAACVLCSSCSVDDVAVYKVKLRALWSEERFPKDYPIYWPKAQWSHVFGQSHNSSYTLYKVGEVARDTVRTFSRLAKIDDLIEEGDREARVYDQFSAVPIKSGVGETENMVFVDGEHSFVSLITRIIPSPDWFVGVDSLNLCVNSAWIEQITLDLQPLDAGAANGRTFTAPKWETNPPEPVSRHGPKKPNHPAAGFYYPDLRELPVIAQVEFSKLKEYTPKEFNELARKEVLETLKLKNLRKSRHQMLYSEKKQEAEETENVSVSNKLEQLMSLEEEPFGIPRPDDPDAQSIVVTEPPPVKKTTTHRTTTTTTTEPEFGNDLRSMDDVVLAVAHGRKLGLGKNLPRHFRSRLHHAVNKLTINDCLVSEWSLWTPCSVTCGFGEKFRTRQIVREPTKNGRKCPKLKQVEHCGDANSCYNIDYFSW